MSDAAALENNLKLIPVHEALTRAMVWLPIFVLFTRARFGLDGALELAAVYYFFVVAIEVPSGWMSDRVGRVPTLRLAAVAWIAAHGCFIFGDDRFVVIVAGQLMLAVGFAFLSGTDVALHYDSLEALERGHEYAGRQARVASLGYAATAASAILGGLLGLVDLRLTFVVALALAAVQFVVASRFVEPPKLGKAETFSLQILDCLRYLKGRYLGWLFFYGIALVTLEHVAFTLMQPWLTDALDRTAENLGATPLLAGIVFAVVAAVGSLAARASAPLAERLGTVEVLLLLAALSATIVSGMALTFSLALIVLVAFRSAQGAAAPVLISAAVAPRVGQQHRATLLSLNSLAGRFGYGAILWRVSDRIEDDTRGVLRILATLSWVLVVVLIVTAVFVRGPARGLGALGAP